MVVEDGPAGARALATACGTVDDHYGTAFYQRDDLECRKSSFKLATDLTMM